MCHAHGVNKGGEHGPRNHAQSTLEPNRLLGPSDQIAEIVLMESFGPKDAFFLSFLQNPLSFFSPKIEIFFLAKIHRQVRTNLKLVV